MKHVEELIAIIESDAEIQCEYLDEYGRTCALGGIARQFGWNPKRLPKGNSSSIYELPDGHLKAALLRAMKHFDVSQDFLLSVQRDNDHTGNTDERRKKIVARIRLVAEAQP